MRSRLWKVIAPVSLLLLAIVHAPLPAQARFFDLLPYPLPTSEPVVLVLTGIALLSLSRYRAHRTRSTDRRFGVSDVRARPGAKDRRRNGSASTKRAA